MGPLDQHFKSSGDPDYPLEWCGPKCWLVLYYNGDYTRWHFKHIQRDGPGGWVEDYYYWEDEEVDALEVYPGTRFKCRPYPCLRLVSMCDTFDEDFGNWCLSWVKLLDEVNKEDWFE